jgi:hypothetical protein
MPSDHYVLARDQLKKVIAAPSDAGKVSETHFGWALNFDGSPPFFRMPRLHSPFA